MPLAFRTTRRPSAGSTSSNGIGSTGATVTVGFGAGVAAAAAFAFAVHKAARLRSTVGPAHWKSLVAEDGTVRDFEEMLHQVAEKGLEPVLRPEVWPLLLGVFGPEQTLAERAALYADLQRGYEQLLWQCQELDAACLAATSVHRSSLRRRSCCCSGLALPAAPREVAAAGAAGAEAHGTGAADTGALYLTTLADPLRPVMNWAGPVSTGQAGGVPSSAAPSQEGAGEGAATVEHVACPAACPSASDGEPGSSAEVSGPPFDGHPAPCSATGRDTESTTSSAAVPSELAARKAIQRAGEAGEAEVGEMEEDDDDLAIPAPVPSSSEPSASASSSSSTSFIGRISRADLPEPLRPYWEAQQSIAMDAVRVDFRKALLPGAPPALLRSASQEGDGGGDGGGGGGEGGGGGGGGGIFRGLPFGRAPSGSGAMPVSASAPAPVSVPPPPAGPLPPSAHDAGTGGSVSVSVSGGGLLRGLALGRSSASASVPSPPASPYDAASRGVPDGAETAGVSGSFLRALALSKSTGSAPEPAQAVAQPEAGPRGTTQDGADASGGAGGGSGGGGGGTGGLFRGLAFGRRGSAGGADSPLAYISALSGLSSPRPAAAAPPESGSEPVAGQDACDGAAEAGGARGFLRGLAFGKGAAAEGTGSPSPTPAPAPEIEGPCSGYGGTDPEASASGDVIGANGHSPGRSLDGSSACPPLPPVTATPTASVAPLKSSESRLAATATAGVEAAGAVALLGLLASGDTGTSAEDAGSAPSAPTIEPSATEPAPCRHSAVPPACSAGSGGGGGPSGGFLRGLSWGRGGATADGSNASAPATAASDAGPGLEQDAATSVAADGEANASSGGFLRGLAFGRGAAPLAAPAPSRPAAALESRAAAGQDAAQAADASSALEGSGSGVGGFLRGLAFGRGGGGGAGSSSLPPPAPAPEATAVAAQDGTEAASSSTSGLLFRGLAFARRGSAGGASSPAPAPDLAQSSAHVAAAEAESRAGQDEAEAAGGAGGASFTASVSGGASGGVGGLALALRNLGFHRVPSVTTATAATCPRDTGTGTVLAGPQPMATVASAGAGAAAAAGGGTGRGNDAPTVGPAAVDGESATAPGCPRNAAGSGPSGDGSSGDGGSSAGGGSAGLAAGLRALGFLRSGATTGTSALQAAPEAAGLGPGPVTGAALPENRTSSGLAASFMSLAFHRSSSVTGPPAPVPTPASAPSVLAPPAAPLPRPTSPEVLAGPARGSAGAGAGSGSLATSLRELCFSRGNSTNSTLTASEPGLPWSPRAAASEAAVVTAAPPTDEGLAVGLLGAAAASSSSDSAVTAAAPPPAGSHGGAVDRELMASGSGGGSSSSNRLTSWLREKVESYQASRAARQQQQQEQQQQQPMSPTQQEGSVPPAQHTVILAKQTLQPGEEEEEEEEEERKGQRRQRQQQEAGQREAGGGAGQCAPPGPASSRKGSGSLPPSAFLSLATAEAANASNDASADAAAGGEDDGLLVRSACNSPVLSEAGESEGDGDDNDNGNGEEPPSSRRAIFEDEYGEGAVCAQEGSPGPQGGLAACDGDGLGRRVRVPDPRVCGRARSEVVLASQAAAALGSPGSPLALEVPLAPAAAAAAAALSPTPPHRLQRTPQSQASVPEARHSPGEGPVAGLRQRPPLPPRVSPEPPRAVRATQSCPPAADPASPAPSDGLPELLASCSPVCRREGRPLGGGAAALETVTPPRGSRLSTTALETGREVGGGAGGDARDCSQQQQQQCEQQQQQRVDHAAAAAGRLGSVARFHLDQAAHFSAAQRRQVERLVAVLSAYAARDPGLGYCQGMSDLALPFILLLEDDVLAFWCFVRLMAKLRANFQPSPSGAFERLATLGSLLAALDPPLGAHLARLGADHCHFAHRMVAVQLRRELSGELAVRLWEQLWADDALEALAVAREGEREKEWEREGEAGGGVEMVEMGGLRRLWSDPGLVEASVGEEVRDDGSDGAGPVVAVEAAGKEGAGGREGSVPVRDPERQALEGTQPSGQGEGEEQEGAGAPGIPQCAKVAEVAARPVGREERPDTQPIRPATGEPPGGGAPSAADAAAVSEEVAASTFDTVAAATTAATADTSGSGADTTPATETNEAAAPAAAASYLADETSSPWTHPTASPPPPVPSQPPPPLPLPRAPSFSRELFPFVVAAIIISHRRRLLECSELDDVLRVFQSLPTLGRSDIADALKRAREYRERVAPRPQHRRLPRAAAVAAAAAGLPPVAPTAAPAAVGLPSGAMRSGSIGAFRWAPFSPPAPKL